MTAIATIFALAYTGAQITAVVLLARLSVRSGLAAFRLHHDYSLRHPLEG